MGLTIGSGAGSLLTQNTLNQTGQQINTLSGQLATGNRLTSSAIDPADSAILSQYAAQLAGNQQSISNLNDGISLGQVAGGALGQLIGNTQQLQTLAVQAGDPTLSGADRQALQAQVNQISQANASIIQTTQFNGVSVFQGGAQTYQAGAAANAQITVPTPDLTGGGGNGGLYSAAGQINLTTQAGATQALTQLSGDLNTLTNYSAQLGAANNGLAAAANNLGQTNVNLAASSSAIGSTDYAATISQLMQTQTQNQVALTVQNLSNVNAGRVLSLLSS